MGGGAWPLWSCGLWSRHVGVAASGVLTFVLDGTFCLCHVLPRRTRVTGRYLCRFHGLSFVRLAADGEDSAVRAMNLHGGVRHPCRRSGLESARDLVLAERLCFVHSYPPFCCVLMHCRLKS